MNTEEKVVVINGRLKELIGTEFLGRVLKGTYTEASVVFKVEIPLVDGDGMKQAMRAEFNRIAFSYRLKPEDFDLPLSVHGTPVKLTSVNLARRKYPFTVEAENGAAWRVGPDVFLAARARSQVVA